MMKKYLTINKCPKHGFWSISLDDESGGHRLTPTKCCGYWETITEWQLNAAILRDIAKELECAADELEKDVL
jgi:hypothetical protein